MRKGTRIYAVAIITFIVILLGVVTYLRHEKKVPEMENRYINSVYGVSFMYPQTYNIKENAISGNQAGVLVTLTKKSTLVPVDGEGPVAITITMYTGTSTTATSSSSSQSSLDAWIETSPDSNFRLLAQDYVGTTTMRENDARLYTWSGLYRGTSIVTEHSDNILMFSVTYDDDLDIKQDFTDLVASVEFTNPGTGE